MHAPSYKHYALAELEWLVVPAVVANQFSLAGARTEVAGLTVPVAVALWAKVSRETDARLSANPQIPLRLTPEEWTGGDILWLIDAGGPQQAVGPMIDRLRTTVFAGQPVKTRMMGKDAKPWIVTLEAKQQADAPEEGAAAEAGEAAQDTP